MLKLRRSIPAVVALALCAGVFFVRLAVCDDKADQMKDFKASFDSVKDTFDSTKETVDSTTQFFGKFNSAMQSWRSAIEEKTQEGAITSVQNTTGDKAVNLASAAFQKVTGVKVPNIDGATIDKMAELLAANTGMKIPDNLTDTIKNKIGASILNQLPVDQQNALGYMYTLNQIDQKLQSSSIYQKLSDAKNTLSDASGMLGKMNQAVNFVNLFDPNTNGSATGGLTKISDVLGAIADLTGEIPLMGQIIKGYADVTKGFVTALDGLKKKMKAGKLDSLGDDSSTDVGIRDRVMKDYPQLYIFMYESINGECPALAPVRGWKNYDDNGGTVLLYYGPADGSGQLTEMNPNTFGILYSYHEAMKNSIEDPSKKEYDPGMFMNRAVSAGLRDYSSSDAKFKDYYEKFEGAGCEKFVKALTDAGKVNKDNYLISMSGEKIYYRLYSQKKNEFAGLCLYEAAFRQNIEGLIANYYGQMALSGTVTAKSGGPVDNISVYINGVVVNNIKKSADGNTFEVQINKGGYDVTASAPGYQDWKKQKLAENPLAIQMEPVAQGVSVDFKVQNSSGAAVSGLAARVNNAPINTITSTPSGSTFSVQMDKTPYDIEVSAPGYLEYKQSGLTDNPLIIIMQAQPQQQAINFKVQASTGGPVGGLSVKVNGSDVTNITNAADGNKFSVLVQKVPYDVEAAAQGYVTYKQSGLSANPLIIVMQAQPQQQQPQGPVQPVLSGPDQAGVNTPASFSVEFGTNTGVGSQCTYLWDRGKIQGNASGQSASIIFDKEGDGSISVDVSGPKGTVSQITLSKKLKVTPAGPVSFGSVVSLSLLSQNCWPGQPEDVTISVTGLSKSTYSAVGLIVSEKTTNTRLTAPDPFVPPTSGDVSEGAHTLKYTAPLQAGNYTLTVEAHGKTTDGKEVVLGKDQKNFTVGSAALTAPDQVKPGDTFQASINASDAMFQNVKKISWDGGTIKSQDPNGRSVKMMISASAAVTATVIFAAGQCVLEKDVTIPGDTSAPAVPAGWTRNYPSAIRTPQYLNGNTSGRIATAAPDSPSGAVANLYASINFTYKDVSDFGSKDEWHAYRDSIDKACSAGTATKFTNDKGKYGTMKGAIYDMPPKTDGFAIAAISVNGEGYCANEDYDMPVAHVFTYTITGQGRGGTDEAWLKSEAQKAVNEIKAIVAVESFKDDGAKYNSAQPSKPPVITLTADKTKLHRGDSAALTVTVKPVPDGEAPLAYAWDGNVSASNETAAFLAAESGKQTIKVTVTGKKTTLGTASVDINVGDYKVTLSKASPASDKIPVGAPVKFSAEVLDGGKPANPAPVLRWQPNSEVTFNPAEGTDAQSAATFKKPGKVSVWVEALENNNGVLSTIAASDNMDLEIILPEITVTPSSDKPMIGEQLTLQAASNPKVEDIDYRWDLPANAKLVEESKDASSITIYLVDDKEAVITANARVPVTGEGLGSGQCKVTASDYEVTVNVLGPDGPRPMTWVEGQGLVEDKKGIATGQNVNVKALISPVPPKTPRWKWKLDEDSTIVSGGTSQQMTANRSSKGECTADVEAFSADGISLGKGSGSFTVSESQDDITKSKKKGDAHDKLAQAKAMIPLGKLDEAITLCDQAAAEEPDLQEAKDLSAKTKTDRTKISSSIDMMHKGIFLKQYDSAANYWNTANAVSSKYAPVLAAKKELDDALKTAAKEKKDADDAAKKKADQAAKDNADKEKADKAAKDKADKEAKDKADKTAKDKADKDKADKTNTAATDKGGTAKGPGGAVPSIVTPGSKTANTTSAVKAPSTIDLEAKKKADEAAKIDSKKQSINKTADKLVSDFNAAVAKSGDKYRDTAKLEQAVANYQDSLNLKQDDQTAAKQTQAKTQLTGRKTYVAALVNYEGLQTDAKSLADKKDFSGAVVKSQEAKAAYKGSNPDMVLRGIDNQIYRYQVSDGDAKRADGNNALKNNDILGAIADYEKAHKAYPATYPDFMQLNVQIGDLKNRVNASKDWRKNGAKAEKQHKTQEAIDDYQESVKLLPDAQLSEHIEELNNKLASSQAAASAKSESSGAGQPADTAAVKQFYADFAKAYESKNESKVMSMVSPDWTAGDGTSCSDLRDTLHTSFGMFDEIRYALSDLTLQPSKGGACTASYKVKITGKIYENNITHEEESSVTEQVAPDERGKLRIIKTGEGNFWHIE